MDWSKCKNVVIFLLLLLNIVLFALNAQSDARYRLSAEAESNITQVLQQNNITLEAPLLKHFEPMRPIALKSNSFASGIPIDALFDKSQTIYRTVEFDKTIFNQDNKRVIFSTNEMTYTNERKTSCSNLAAIDPRTVCESFLSSLSLDFENIAFDYSVMQNDCMEVWYYEVLDGNPLFHNTVYFKLDDEGVFYAKVTKYDVIGATGSFRDIYSSDEALLALLPTLLASNEPAAITKIEMGYAIEDFPSTSFRSFASIPCYRIFVSTKEMPYYVSAYTNKIIKVDTE